MTQELHPFDDPAYQEAFKSMPPVVIRGIVTLLAGDARVQLILDLQSEARALRRVHDQLKHSQEYGQQSAVAKMKELFDAIPVVRV